VDYRKRREVDPTLHMLRESMAELENTDEAPHAEEKMREMLDLFEISDSLYQQAQKIPTKTIVRIARMGDVISKILKFFPE
jgi:DNA-binding transcriptional regulator GbsR (MarR family)